MRISRKTWTNCNIMLCKTWNKYCSIFQHLAKRFGLCQVNHKNKQTNQVETSHRTIIMQSTYMYIQHPLGNNGIKLLTCKGSSFNSSSIFFAKQCHVDISFHVILIFKVLRVLTNILLNSYKLFYNPFFQAIFEREWLKELRNCILCIIFV